MADLTSMTMRQRFEHWYSEEGKWPAAVDKDARGDYMLMQTALAWKAWQAADESAQVAYGPSGDQRQGGGVEAPTTPATGDVVAAKFEQHSTDGVGDSNAG